RQHDAKRLADGNPEVESMLLRMLLAHDTNQPLKYLSTAGSGFSIRYELINLAARGGSAEVWRGRDTRLQDGSAYVAIKKLSSHASDSTWPARFEREVSILQTVSHPHIAGIHGSGVASDGRPFIVMEYVDGRPITEHCDCVKLSIAGRLSAI